MPPIAKLVCNRNGWESPSGIDCKFQGLHGHLHEAVYGFGFEEWLFRGFNFIDNNQEQWYLGYVQAFDNINEGFEINTLYVSTNLYPNQNNICLNQTKRIVGKLNVCKKLTLQDRINAHNDFFDLNGMPQLPLLLRNELEATLIGDNRLEQALASFDEHLFDNNVFNVKFSSAQRYNLPPNEHTNWNFLEAPHGIINHIPENFTLNNIANDLIIEYIAANGGFIPQVLMPL
jgi:hypothetical protein